MLQKHILAVKKQNAANQTEIEELEHYGWRQCLRFEGVLIEKNGTSDKVLTRVMDLWKEVGVNIPDTVIDRAHRRGVAYINNKSKKGCKNIILHFTNFVTKPWFTGQRKT